MKEERGARAQSLGNITFTIHQLNFVLSAIYFSEKAKSASKDQVVPGIWHGMENGDVTRDKRTEFWGLLLLVIVGIDSIHLSLLTKQKLFNN